MYKQPDLLRRNVVRYLSSIPLLPLAGVGSASAAAGTFAFAGLKPDFEAAVTGLTLTEDLHFGSSAVPSGTAVSAAIKTLADVAARFNPLEGDFGPNGAHQGGTGPVTINSEVQRYATEFNPQNHVLEADGLRLQAVLSGGHFNSYLRGNVVTTGNGFNAGAEGASAPTRLADIGLTVADLAKIEVGTCITGGSNSGIAVVVAKDAGAGTITFEAVSSGIKTAYKGNWHVTFTTFAFARVAAEVSNGGMTTLKFKTPLASTVVPGMFAMGINGDPGYYNDPRAADRARVASVAADRLSVTFDKPVRFGRPLSVLTPGGDNTGDGVLFVPGLSSGQIWSKRAYGPQRPGFQVQALEVEITMPAMPSSPAAATTPSRRLRRPWRPPRACCGDIGRPCGSTASIPNASVSRRRRRRKWTCLNCSRASATVHRPGPAFCTPSPTSAKWRRRAADSGPATRRATATAASRPVMQRIWYCRSPSPMAKSAPSASSDPGQGGALSRWRCGV